MKLSIGADVHKQGFNKEDLNSLLFPLPPLAEQYRIVEKYEKAIASIMSR